MMFSVSILVLLEEQLLFEKHHKEYLDTGRGTNFSIPTTTLGIFLLGLLMIYKVQVEISHSITCSTTAHAVLNGIAWLKSGMVDKFFGWEVKRL
jgi:hypothetical protein